MRDRTDFIDMQTLGNILEAITGETITELAIPIANVVIDSRQAISGSLFVALPGEKVDGHEYVSAAFEAGAIAALVDRELSLSASVIDLRRPLSAQLEKGLEPPLLLRSENALEALQQAAKGWRAKFDIRVVGITGSVGKSTTKELTATVLEQRYHTVRSPGNLNNEIGLPLSLLSLRSEHERAVLEMGFYVPGEIALLCEIGKPQVGVVTNISEVHLERAGSLEAIVEGKGELVESLPSSPEGVAILNYDDPRVKEMAKRTQARVFYYGLSPEAHLWASDVESLGLDGLRCVVHYGDDHVHLRVPLLGRHSVHTVLRATAVALVEGLGWQEIGAGLQSTRSQLRLLAVHTPSGALLLDDTYNAAPSSTLAALNLLEELDGRKWAVLGDMLELGDYEERGHRMVGVRAAQIADVLVTVGQRARWISEEAKRAGLPLDQIVELKDSDAAIDYLQEQLGEGDVVLVKGSRGMEMDRIVSVLESGV
jgi:UDP-N-acetylmuramoyl-tripeptide--D-alanyl-D-alanine ligase